MVADLTGFQRDGSMPLNMGILPYLILQRYCKNSTIKNLCSLKNQTLVADFPIMYRFMGFDACI
jgi:hypothetical protein